MEARGSLGEFIGSSLTKVSTVQILSVPTQERTFQPTTLLSEQLSGPVWAEPIPFFPVVCLLY